VLLHALLICGSTLGAFAWGLTDSPSHANAMAFMTLALAQVFHLGNARSLDPVLRPARAVANRFALLAVALSLTLQAAAMYVEPLPRVLRVSALGLGDWAVVLGFSAVPALAGQCWKLLRSARHR
jgi:Ca2+-transporting ATPase